MIFSTNIRTTLFNIFKSILYICLHRSVLFLRFFLLFIICLYLLYFSSIHYYSFYCTYRFKQSLIEANKRDLWNTRDGVEDRFMPILMPVCDRPHYLKRVIDGLIKVDGINEVNEIFLY